MNSPLLFTIKEEVDDFDDNSVTKNDDFTPQNTNSDVKTEYEGIDTKGHGDNVDIYESLETKSLQNVANDASNSTTVHRCDHCGKICSYPSELKKHIRIHTSEKPCKCGTCNKRFSRNDSLQRHIMIHTGDEPYKCDVCDSAFSKSGI